MGDRQTIAIQLGPLAQKTPQQTGTTGTLGTVQNMVPLKGDADGVEYWPRPGVSAVSRASDTGTITSGIRMATLGPALLLQTGNALFRKASDEWHQVTSNAPIMGVKTASICANAQAVGSCDSKYVGGYTISAYTTNPGFATGTLSILVTDATGATIMATAIDFGNIASVRIVVSGAIAVVFYQITANQLRAWKFDSASPASLPGAVNITSTSAFSFPYDAQTVGASGTVVVGWLDTGTSTYRVALLTVSTMVVGTPVNTTIAGVSAFSFLVNDWSTNVIYVAWGGTGTFGINVTLLNGSTLATNSTSQYPASILAISSITGVRVGASVTVLATTTSDSSLSPALASAADYKVVKSTGSGFTVVMRGAALASKAISANGTVYALMRYQGTGQGTCFLVDVNGQNFAPSGIAIGKCLQNLAATGTAVGADQLPSLDVAATANTWQTAALKNIADAATATGGAAYVGAVAITFTRLDSTVGRGVELNGGCHFPGAMPYLYDGQGLVEEGFAVAPEQCEVTQLAGGVMTLLASYVVRCVYSWTDAAGNLHRSGPTLIPQTVTLTGTNNQFSLAIPTLRNTRKTGVSIEVYVTVANAPSAYFNAVPFGTPLLNDPTVDRVNFTVNLTDVQIAAGEPLYTDGNILDNLPPPPCKAFVAHRGRLLASGIDGDPQAVWFAKDVEPGFGIAFNDGLVSRLQAAADPITSIISMDSFAIACTVGGTTWATSDQYPDDTLTGGVMTFQQYSSNVGCTGTGLMARTDDGVTMWGGSAAASANVPPKNIWRLSRGLAFDYLGAAIEGDATGFTPVAVMPVPAQNQIRVIGTDAGGVSCALVYESVFKTWCTWRYTQQATAIVDAVLWNGVASYLCSDGTVLTENATGYDDLGVAASVAHIITIVSVNLAGVGGFKRIYLAQFTGRVLGTGGFTARADQTIDGVAQTRKTLAIGVSDTALNMEVDPGPNGKCSDYGLSFSDAGNGANTAWTLAAVTLDCKIKPNANRLPPSRRAT